jgi:hypothetical protein
MSRFSERIRRYQAGEIPQLPDPISDPDHLETIELPHNSGFEHRWSAGWATTISADAS